MIKEKSCGAVIFKYDDKGNRLFLIEHMGLGHYSMCKGHVEDNETEHETAIREIKEETNLEVKFIDGFKEEIGYFPFAGVFKTVVYFLATPLKDIHPEDKHDDEVTEVVYLPFEQALTTLTHQDDKNVLSLANEFLNKLEIL